MITAGQRAGIVIGQTLDETTATLGVPEFRDSDMLAYLRADDGLVTYLTFTQGRLATIKEDRV